MKSRSSGSALVPVLLLVLVGLVVAVLVVRRLLAVQEEDAGGGPRSKVAAPVEVRPIERGAIELRRTFIGALEAPAEFVVSSKVGGRVERLAVDLSDEVERNQIVAWLDDNEFVQAEAQAAVELTVAEANRTQAVSALEIAVRARRRVETLRERGVASEQQFDVVQADELARKAGLAVAQAQVKRAQAALESARIRVGYTKVTAGWRGGADRRIVSGRFAEEGDTVGANAPLLSIVELDPLDAVIQVTERDFARLGPGQSATLTTDAFPGETFAGTITRISPVFRQATRQARVELTVPNPGSRLKPGMFIRATVVLETVAVATLVPYRAITARGDRRGVFVVSADGASVAWREVTLGIRDGDRVQVEGVPESGRVVTLGQHLVDDGSPITIPGAAENDS